MKLFRRHHAPFSSQPKREIPAGLWTKCEACSQLIYNKALDENLRVCPKCDFHFPLTAHQWLALTLTVPEMAAPGSYYLGILADPANTVPEIDETNNARSIPLTIQ